MLSIPFQNFDGLYVYQGHFYQTPRILGIGDMYDMRTFSKVMQVTFGIGSKHSPKLPTSLLTGLLLLYLGLAKLSSGR